MNSFVFSKLSAVNIFFRASVCCADSFSAFKTLRSLIFLFPFTPCFFYLSLRAAYAVVFFFDAVEHTVFICLCLHTYASFFPLSFSFLLLLFVQCLGSALLVFFYFCFLLLFFFGF